MMELHGAGETAHDALELMAENLPEQLSVDQAAELLQIHPKTVIKRITEGVIPAYRTGDSPKSAWKIDKGLMLLHLALAYGNEPAKELARRRLAALDAPAE